MFTVINFPTTFEDGLLLKTAYSHTEIPTMTTVNKHLTRERKNISFSVSDLSDLLNGGRAVTERRRFLRSLVDNDPIFDVSDRPFVSRAQYYVRVLEKVKRLIELKQEYRLSVEDYYYLDFAVGEAMPNILHETLFIPTLQGQMSDEQLAQWLPLAKTNQIFGCYAQTELGHGSNLRKLETTATFIQETDEFELHSPTLTSLKWWPGALARSSNYAAVFAHLILPDGKDYGMHVFLTQIRDGNHDPMPGIEVGDIGPKLGFNSIDNGYLRLTHVRVPRSQMMQRFSKVSRDGVYSRSLHDKLAYATMVSVRADIVTNSSQHLAKAMTIAVRYSAVRSQGNNPSGEGEYQILDYTKQQHTLMTSLGLTYALHYTGKYMREMFEANLRNIMNGGDTSMMEDVHAVSSGLKAVCSQMVVESMELARQACGGHGYSHLSGLPWLYEMYAQYPTVEGENTILHLQTGPILLKQLARARADPSSLSPHIAYLADAPALLSSRCPVQREDDWLDPSVQLRALQHRDVRQMTALANDMDAARRAAGDKQFDVKNQHMLEIIQISKSHCQTTIVYTFHHALPNIQRDHPQLYPAIKRLSDLHALHTIQTNLADFLIDGHVDAHQAAMLATLTKRLVREARHDAVGYVDAFEFSDTTLASALGRYDGNVYEALYKWAKLGEEIVKDGGGGVKRDYREVLREIREVGMRDTQKAKL